MNNSPIDSPGGTCPPILLDTEAAAAALGISLRHFVGLEKSGRIGPMPIRLGKCVRYSVDSLRAWGAAGAMPREQWLRDSGGQSS